MPKVQNTKGIIFSRDKVSKGKYPRDKMPKIYNAQGTIFSRDKVSKGKKSYLKWLELFPWTASVKCCGLGLGNFDSSSRRLKIPCPLDSIRSIQSWLSTKEIFLTPKPSFSYKSCSSLRILWLKNCCNFSLQ